MAVIDNIVPKQRVSCDLCKEEFDRPLALDQSFAFGDKWETVSIKLYPHISARKFCALTVEHACLSCRTKFYERASEIVKEMTKEIGEGNG